MRAVLDKDIQQRWIDKNSVYATTAAEKEVALIVQLIATGIQKMIDAGLDPRRMAIPPANWFVQNHTKETHVNIQVYKQLAGMITAD